MTAPRVLILHNEPVLPAGHPDAEAEYEVLETAGFVRGTLEDAGFTAERLGIGNDPAALMHALAEQRPDAVFNLFEGTADYPASEAVVAGTLEWLEIPFTGCPSRAMVLAKDKAVAKVLFRGAGLPTASFLALCRLPVPEHQLAWPLIVKPAAEDASVGIDQKSVVTNQRQLADRVEYLLATYGAPVLVEEYISGRELCVALLEAPELMPLPISEIEFTHATPGYWPIVTYDAKWHTESHECLATPARYPAEVAPDLAWRVQGLAVRAYRLLGCRDFARVDFRVRPDGEILLLEVNPNPSYHPGAGFGAAVQSAGLTHAQVTVDLVRTALARRARKHDLELVTAARP